MTSRRLSDADLAAGRRLMARLDAFAGFTDEPGRLTRLFLSDAHKRAALAFIGWCAEAGLEARIDAAGNVVARYESRTAGAPALMLGSHIDTVRDAGRYDGNYGALAALAVVEALAARGERLEHAVEIVAFGDEEGVRFRSTLTGSRALAGAYEDDALDQKDSAGVRMRDALKAFGGDPDEAGSIRARNVAAFVEAHIEQGPVLEAAGLPLGVVTAINGATRLEVGVDGVAGHAGATPMSLRRDALTATAEMALAIEARARREADLVATVGRLEVWPGAANVIPGHTQFSIDLRVPDDVRRAAALADLEASIHSIAAARGVSATVGKTHEADAFVCDPRIVAGLAQAVEAVGVEPRLLPSGAGHDTMVMGGLAPAGMLFVRCKGGISHNPLESITPEDCAFGLAALTRFVRDFRIEQVSSSGRT
ncbi:MAG TPA: allantoate amidohydrolase [Roseiarcus sp.]|nr:allantoate amidohydrolase [Roseiarcus sp.]